MQSLGSIAGVLVTLLALAAIAGVLYVYARGSADKATIESQGKLLVSRKDEIDDLTRRVTALEAENHHLQNAVAQVRGIDTVQATVDSIKRDTAALVSAVVV